MACDAVTIGVGVLFGPVDDVISHEETASQQLLFGKEQAIETAIEAIRAHLEERLPEGNAFKVYFAVEKAECVDGNDYREDFDGEKI